MIRLIIEPGILFGIWMLFILGISCAYFQDEINCTSVLFILICISAALFGSFLSRVLEYKVRSTDEDNLTNRSFVWPAFIWTSIAWMTAIIKNIYPMIAAFSFADPTLTKNLATEAFVQSEGLVLSTESAFSGLIGLILYIAGIPSLFLGGKLLARGRIVGITPLLLGALYSFVSFSRFHFFVYLLLFFYSYFIEKTEYCIKTRVASGKILSVPVISLFVFLAIAYLRLEQGSSLYNTLMTYLFGGVAAFNQWFNGPEWSTLGNFTGRTIYSFMSWFAKLGYTSPPSPLHLEFIPIGQSTINAYSLFRLFVEDFGILFTPLLLAIFGFLGGLLARFCVARRSFPCVPIIAFLWTFSFFSFYTSITVDTRTLFGCLFASFLFSLLNRKKHLIATGAAN